MTRSALLGRLTVILLLAVAVRAVDLGGRTLWYDEAFSVLFAENGPAAMLNATLAQEAGASAEEHPLLYYTLLNVWMRLVGQAPEAVRALSLLIGVLTVAVIYRLARDLFDDARVGSVAALVMALAPFPVQYAREARMYALLAFCLALATWCFVRGWQTVEAQRAAPLHKRSAWLWWAAFGVFAALGMYTQQLAAFYLLALAMFPLALRRWEALARLAAGALLALVLYLPWLLQLPGQVGKLNQAYWVPSPGPAQVMQTLFALTVPLLELSQWIMMGGLFVAMLLVIFLAWRGYLARRTAGWRLGLVLWLTFVPPALMFVAGQTLPVYLLRALLPCAVIGYVGVAWLFVRGRMPRPIVGVIVALWLLVGGAGLVEHYRWRTFPNAPFDEAVAYLVDARQPDDVIVHSNKITFLPMVYYDRALPQTFVADPPGAPQDTLAVATQRVLGVQEQPCVQAAVSGAERVWFVIVVREIVETQGARDTALDWLVAHYPEVDNVAFEDLLIIHFGDPDATARAATTCPEGAP